jgi:hypothetical protein
LLFGFEKPIDDDGASFKRCAAGAPGGFAADHRGTGIDREQSPIGKRYPAAVRNAARIDRAMARPEAGAG